MSVALMGNLSNAGSTDETGNPTWEQARLGHCVVVVELISRLRTLRKNVVGLFDPPVENCNLSDFTGCRVRRSRCVYHGTRITVSCSVGGEGMSQRGYTIYIPVAEFCS